MDNVASGAQSVERAMALLAAVGARDTQGASIAELAADTGLNRTTTHRLVVAMTRHGLFERDAQGRHHLGATIANLGMIASRRHGWLQAAGDMLQRLAAETGDTAFLSTTSGYDAICVRREEGDFPIRTQVLWPGQRYPLGVGAGSLAMLAAMPDSEVSEILAANQDRISASSPTLTAAIVRDMVEETRQAGHAFNMGAIVAGSWAVGVALLDGRGRPIGALSLAAIETRMQPQRRAELVQRLCAARDRLRDSKILP